MKKKYYYVFGSKVAETYHENGAEEALALAEEQGDFDVFCFNPTKNHPSDLLLAADGWMGFAEITAKEYKEFLKLQTSKPLTLTPWKD